MNLEQRLDRLEAMAEAEAVASVNHDEWVRTLFDRLDEDEQQDVLRRHQVRHGERTSLEAVP